VERVDKGPTDQTTNVLTLRISLAKPQIAGIMRGLGDRLLGKAFEGCPVSGVGGLGAFRMKEQYPG